LLQVIKKLYWLGKLTHLKVSSMISQFIGIAKELEAKFSKEAFSKESVVLLQQLELSLSLSDFEREVANWTQSNDMPKQLNLYNNFGEPSLTLFNNGQFAVDLYFWRSNDTIIHSHAFRGAFKVLYGSSLHEVFSVVSKSVFSSDIQTTNLTSESINILSAGEIHEINSELTHKVVHLADPTVTLCVRTVEDTELDQWHHLSTGLSYKKSNLSVEVVKQVLYFQYLLNSDLDEANLYLDHLLSKLKISAQISLYESLCYGELGLSDHAFQGAEQKFKIIFEAEPWFGLYQKYHQQELITLNDLNIKDTDLKLLIHSANAGYGKESTANLLLALSNSNLQEVYEKVLIHLNTLPSEIQKSYLLKLKPYA